MRRKLPSTTALEAFEAAARHQSFTKAAETLSLTQSAVCRQINALEDFLQVSLFRRTRRGVTLTEAGLEYAQRVARRLDEVERDTLQLMAQGGTARSLELAVVPTFGTQWLLPRLARFQAAHPGVQVHLGSRTRPFLFSETAFDAAIHADEPGGGGWPGTEQRPLLQETLMAVAAPQLLARCLGPAAAGLVGAEPGSGLDRPLDAGEWARLPLLQPSTRPWAWRQFFEQAGLDVPQALAGQRMELFSMITEAALLGLGVALTPPFLVQPALATGRLLALSAPRPSGRHYALIYPVAKADKPALRAFGDWLQAECARPDAGAPPARA